MSRILTLTRRLVVAALAIAATSASAITVDLYVDSAPNVYGSPNYAPWWSGAQANAMAGTFVNMANSHNPANAGTTLFQIEDVTVYSFGDLGQRLHFIYWVPGETIASLQAMNFQVSLDYDWDGANEVGFSPAEPSRWIENGGGVIGTAGWAWWGAYGVNTQEALDEDLAAWAPLQGDINFHVYVDGQEINSLTASPRVPDGGATAALLGVVLLGFGGLRRWIGRRTR